MLQERDKIVIGRKWNNPKIYTVVNVDKIEMDIDLENFSHALAEEIGNPTFIMTKAQLEKKIHSAIKAVVSEIKTASREVI